MYLSIHLSIYLSVCLSFYLHLHLYLYLCLCLHLYLHNAIYKPRAHIHSSLVNLHLKSVCTLCMSLRVSSTLPSQEHRYPGSGGRQRNYPGLRPDRQREDLHHDRPRRSRTWRLLVLSNYEYNLTYKPTCTWRHLCMASWGY